ncbi:hypothetical protein [Pseudomonas sp. KNUC1026]|uniref:hypothetical protein n=1 Tax=Pseudomonas sp. KNUC1026 TaxID=2893890 RepID=UPI001F4878BE|nr:hypothetical protein [Pseudomonas sp. KNUC1026]UFH51342.1 hypothetical protein LN139_10180 [Pseudomonas sp. KNUC1026]
MLQRSALRSAPQVEQAFDQGHMRQGLFGTYALRVGRDACRCPLLDAAPARGCPPTLHRPQHAAQSIVQDAGQQLQAQWLVPGQRGTACLGQRASLAREVPGDLGNRRHAVQPATHVPLAGALFGACVREARVKCSLCQGLAGAGQSAQQWLMGRAVRQHLAWHPAGLR